METQNKKFNPVWILVVIVVVFFGYMMLNKSTSGTKNPSDSTQPPMQANEQAQEPTQTTGADMTSGDTNPTAMDTTNVKTFTITGANFSFDTKEIKVNKGDTVKIVFKNQEGFHDWKIDEFNATTKVIGAGETDTTTFIADKVGTFEYYCSVGQHRAMGMKGNLIVE